MARPPSSSIRVLLCTLLVCGLCCTVLAAALTRRPHPYVYPGEEVPEDTIRVTTLGSGSPDVRRGQVASGFLIEVGKRDKLLFDLGTGAYVNLVATGVAQGDVTKVFLSHLHSDHMADLASLYVGAMFGRVVPWEVWGPDSETPEIGTAAVIDGLRKFLAWDTFARRRIDFVDREDKGDEVIAHEFDHSIRNQVLYDKEGLRVTSTPVDHYRTAGPVAYRLDWKGLSITYSGDTRPTPELEELANHTDVLLLQNMGPIVNVTALPFSSQYLINSSHITCEQAGSIIARIKPRLAVLHHLTVNDASRDLIVDQVRQGYPKGDIHINEDLDVFDISHRGVVRRKRLVPSLTWGPWVAENNWHAPPLETAEPTTAFAEDSAVAAAAAIHQDAKLIKPGRVRVDWL